MYSQDEIDAVVEAGGISATAAAALRDHVESLRAMPTADEEQVRLITSFNDIFVTIAAVLLFTGLGSVGGIYAGPLMIAAAAWGLSEYFTLKRRMALPSIVFLIVFVGSVGALGTAIGMEAAAGFLSLGAAWLHWWRFQVPITIAAGVAAGVFAVTGLLANIFGENSTPIMGLLLVGGLLTFAYAMHWDMLDPLRRTQKADIAFWLHGLAALLIIHPIFQILDIGHSDSIGSAVVVLAIYVVLGAVALVIDRRALMASALAYVLAAMIRLIGNSGSSEVDMAVSALIIGSTLLLLSAFWTQARRPLVAALPDEWRAKLPSAD